MDESKGDRITIEKKQRDIIHFNAYMLDTRHIDN